MTGPAGAEPPPLPGHLVVERLLGRGGMATVFLARDTRQGRPVAVKVLRPELAAGLGTERFLREIQLASGWHHPNILPVFDSGSADIPGRPGPNLWYTMPYVEGESLRARLERERQLPLADALAITREVADALAFAHARGVVHRDIKPENILLAAGHALVADFGIAMVAEEGGSRLTETGFTLGTAAYMSPEQAAADRHVDGRTDQFALACVLYEMLAGEPPHAGPNPQAILARRLTEPPRSLRVVRESVPPPVEGAILRALALAPADRFATMEAFLAALGATESEPRSPAAPSAPRATRAVRWQRVALAAVVAGIAALAWWGGTHRAEGHDRAPAPRIAVLPLDNISADPADAYLAEGLTAELVSTLSRVEGLRVVPRGTVMAFADRGLGVAALGRELEAGVVLDGAVQKTGARLRVSLQLVDARTEATIWAREFDGAAAEAFELQRNISRAVAGALEVPFPQPGRADQDPARGVDTAAYDLLLRAEYWTAKRVKQEHFDSARVLLREAVRIDPGFAEAYATLAWNESNRIFYFGPDPAAEQEAYVAIRKALALDSTNEAAYVARASLAYTREGGWRHEDALRDLRRAVREHPRSVDARNQLGILAMHIGLLDTALAHLRTAVELDPRNGFAPMRIVRTLWYMGRYEEAVEEARRMGVRHWEVANALQR
ncbi:MAG TPA: protein kinase, partial [Gemmatimonadales bacterium]|nr:protein kinase [Gemmatimonadales bacterium]